MSNKITEQITKTEIKVTVGRLLFEVTDAYHFSQVYPRLEDVLAEHGATANNSVSVDGFGQVVPYANQQAWQWVSYFHSYPIRVYSVFWTEET